jgi:hypothetical protein
MRNELNEEINRVTEIYQSNKKAGSPVESLAFDAGIIEGLRRSLEIIDKEY